MAAGSSWAPRLQPWARRLCARVARPLTSWRRTELPSRCRHWPAGGWRCLQPSLPPAPFGASAP